MSSSTVSHRENHWYWHQKSKERGGFHAERDSRDEELSKYEGGV